MNKIFGLIAITFFLSIGTANAANYGQYGQYGVPCSPGQYGQYGDQCDTEEILIDKKIRFSTKGGVNLVDNLDINEQRFSKDEKVTFEISVTNNSDKTLKSVEVKDIFPEFLSYVSGQGKYDANTRTLSVNLDLASGQTKKLTVVGKVIEPKNVTNGSVCVVNQAMATTQSGEVTRDNASFCIERKFEVLPAKDIVQTPATGPELLPLLGFIPGGIAGLLLRRKSKLS